MSTSIDAKMLAQMFLAGAANLRSNKEWINELNVFPVPDGDTGTNMTMTIMSAVREVNGLGDEYDMMKLCKGISSGSLRGARGNSGVILSQLLRGFCKEVRENDEVDAGTIADAFDRAVDTAYKAVMKPKEGTILTVAKGVAVKTRELVETGDIEFDVLFPEIIAEAESVLAKTPDLLPVLKQAGVVDSGGQGLVQVLKGAYEGYQGKTAVFEEESESAGDGRKALVNPEVRANAEIKFGYCTEFIVMLDRVGSFNAKMEKDFKEFLSSIGDSIVCVADDDVVKVHVHTNDPGLAIQRGLMYGQLSSMKIDNMRLEHKETLFTMTGGQEAPAAEPVPEPVPESVHKDVGFIAVSVGDGIAEIFRGLGVDYIIEGGQTMNPSTEDVLEAIEKVDADTIFILPNNKNIILAANQAAGMTKDKKIIVIPTKTIPQGITTVISYMPELDTEVNRANMTEELKKVKSAEVTYAVRDTVIEDASIHQGDMMGIGDDGILAVGPDRDGITLETLEKMVDENTALISIYYGQDVAAEEAEALAGRAKEKFPGCDIELQPGGQPIYYYILSAEE